MQKRRQKRRGRSRRICLGLAAALLGGSLAAACCVLAGRGHSDRETGMFGGEGGGAFSERSAADWFADDWSIADWFGADRSADASVPAAEPDETGRAGASGRKTTPGDDPEVSTLLVNPWNPLPASWQVSLVQLDRGQAVDERCYPSLQSMMDDCRAAGLHPLICSSYRTRKKQESLFQAEVENQMAAGLSEEEARAETATCIAVPGTSEHQTGLAVDIVDRDNQNLDESQEDTAVQKWLMEHCWEYGFILRYPNEKSEITGIIYEPWHYRYVGRETAREIHRLGVCLEEYLSGQAPAS